MRKTEEPRIRDDFLVRIARFHRENAWHSVCLLLSGSFACVGMPLLLYPVYRAIKDGWSLGLDDLVFYLLGFVGIFVAYFIRVFLCLSRVAHEVLLRLDDDYNSAYGTETESQQEGVIRKSAGDGSTFHSLSQSKLQRLSTRDLNAVRRLLVMVPIVAGVLVLVLSILAWQFPRLGNVVYQRGVRLEYLCLGGLMLMMIAAYLMQFGGIVHRRASKHDGMKK